MPTAPSIPDNCPHERRPGLTVCLHCRHAAREAEAEKRRRSLSRIGLVGAVIGLGAMVTMAALRAREESAGQMLATTASEAAEQVGTTSAATTLAAGDAPEPRDEAAPASASAPDSTSGRDSVSASPVSAPAATVAATPAALTAPDTSAAPTSAPALEPASAAGRVPLSPIVGGGRSELPEGLSVVRSGDSLTVHFDTELGRTRMPEKFERTVRTTLPLLYGARAESLLARLPEGAMASAGDLLTELPAKGVRIPAGDGWTLIVRPETRPGRDGPLVVRYVATVER